MKNPKKIYEKNYKQLKENQNKEYDYFKLTEPGSEDNSIFEYNNILEWDKSAYDFQKQHATQVREEYDALYMSGDWFRALELNDLNKRELVYGTLISANAYLVDSIYDRLSEEIDKKYPSIICRPYGIPFFEKIPDSKYSRMTDSEIRAFGKEKELEDYKKRLREMYPHITQIVINELKIVENCTFRKIGEGSKYDRMDYFIIGGIPVAEQISFKTFFKDFYDKQQPIEVLENISNKIFNKLKKELKC